MLCRARCGSLLFGFLLASTLFVYASDASRDKQKGEKAIRLSELHKRISTGALSGIHSSARRTTVLFFDDFENERNSWQVTAGWGSVPQGPGFANAGKSDWRYESGNASSASHSWHETEAASIQTDMLLSPVIVLPEHVNDAGLDRPLRHVAMNFALDWDAPDPEAQLRIYAGRAENLWRFNRLEPGSGLSAWRCAIPDTGHYTEFVRQFLITPEIDLTTAQEPLRVSFQYQSLTEAGFDFNTVEVSSDDFASYRTLISFNGETALTWKTYSLNLAAFIGTKIKIRFSHNGDFSIVTPGTMFALDEIKVTSGNEILFYDDGGENDRTDMTRAGFAPGNQLVILQGQAQSIPQWNNIDLEALGVDILNGSNGLVAPGDSIRLGFVYVASKLTIPRRGIYLDDIMLTGITQLDHDIAAIDLTSSFPAVSGKPTSFSLRVINAGRAAQTNIAWRGIIRDAAGQEVFQLNGTDSQLLLPDSSRLIPAQASWTPNSPGIYYIEAYTQLAGDEDLSNDTTRVLADDDRSFRGGVYSHFIVADENIIFAAALHDLPADSSATMLQQSGFQVVSSGEAAASSWHTGTSPRYGFRGAVVSADSLGRRQDEELIIPNLDCSRLTARARLSFNGFAMGGRTYTRLSVSVSTDSGRSWSEVYERRLGTDPQTGVNHSDSLAVMNPANLDISSLAAGQPNVAIRFRYESQADGFWVLWKVVVSGEKGLRAAHLKSVMDVPEDQGKCVELVWSPAPNDRIYARPPITQYGIWRGNVDGLSARSEGRINPSAIWELVGNLPAQADSIYRFHAPTKGDKIPIPFFIAAYTENPRVFVNSNIVSGASIDNLPPGAPNHLTAQVDSQTVWLWWDPPAEETPAFYSIYRGVLSGNPGPLPLATTTIPNFVDASFNQTQKYYYVVTATDSSGNQSGASNEVAVSVTNIAEHLGREIPAHFALGQNYPNPFNPSTIIPYQLPQARVARLRIFNAVGQHIRKFELGLQSAGYHHLHWDGLDDHGRAAGNGVYLYRFEAGDFCATRKLILMR
ncbi:T9SS type A sorting domain-containing protein [bacterium]|nr:T9SS type A sorting domain-containing protein [bacterium]